MLNGRPRAPSPGPSTVVDEPILPTAVFDEEPPPTNMTPQSPVIPEIQLSAAREEVVSTPEPTEHSVVSSLSTSIEHGLNELSIEKKNDDIFQNIPEDALDLPYVALQTHSRWKSVSLERMPTCS